MHVARLRVCYAMENYHTTRAQFSFILFYFRRADAYLK